MAPRWQAAWWPESGKLFRPPLLRHSTADRSSFRPRSGTLAKSMPEECKTLQRAACQTRQSCPTAHRGLLEPGTRLWLVFSPANVPSVTQSFSPVSRPLRSPHNLILHEFCAKTTFPATPFLLWVQQLFRVVFEVSTPPSAIAEVRSRESGSKTSSLTGGFIGSLESARCKAHRGNTVPFGHDGHVVCSEFSGNCLIDLDEESQISCGPTRDDRAHGEAAADVPCEPDVCPLESVPTQFGSKTTD